MPSDSNGVYSLPAGYLASDGGTIQASQHNPPLEDIASAITGRLPRNGNAAMTGPLKLPDGTVGAPALTFSSATTVGFFKSTNGVAVTVNGVQVFEFSAIPQGVPVGLIGDWGGGTAPTGWLFCRGQSLLRVSYPALFTAIATVHGAVDADHFSLPNLECCVTAGLDADARGILTGATVLGALVGGQAATLVPSNLPPYTPNGTINTPTISLSAAAGNVVNGAAVGGGANLSGGGGALNQGAITASSSALAFTGTAQGGTSTSFSIVQPTVILNKIIFAGV